MLSCDLIINISFKGIADAFRLNSPLLMNVVAAPLLDNIATSASASKTSMNSSGSDSIFGIHPDSNTIVAMEQRHILIEEERDIAIPLPALKQ
jgi:hypothetical protein